MELRRNFNKNLFKMKTNPHFMEYFKLMDSFGYFPSIRLPTKATSSRLTHTRRPPLDHGT